MVAIIVNVNSWARNREKTTGYETGSYRIGGNVLIYYGYYYSHLMPWKKANALVSAI